MDDYQDRWISCTADGLKVRGYYFPWGTKRIPYAAIRSVRRIELTAARGRGRIWGTANPGYWASLDPQRPGKKVGLVVDLGHRVKPFLTADDPDAVVACLNAHAGRDVLEDDGGPGPIV